MDSTPTTKVTIVEMDNETSDGGPERPPRNSFAQP